MKQLNNRDNQFGSLDPEKIYFVEKFGYLMKKINGGYGRPVQDALYTRINNAVNEFKTDLPNIVHNLEINRLKSISERRNNRVKTNDRKIIAKSEESIKSVEAPKTIDEKIKTIQKDISDKIKAAPQIKSEKILERSTETNVLEKPSIKQTAIEEKIETITDDVRNPKNSIIIKNKSSSILRPSIAIIKEQQRLKRIQAMEQQKTDSKITKPVLKPAVSNKSITTKAMSVPTISKKPISKPKHTPTQELTEWERKWHKYDSDIISNEFKGIT